MTKGASVRPYDDHRVKTAAENAAILATVIRSMRTRTVPSKAALGGLFVVMAASPGDARADVPPSAYDSDAQLALHADPVASYTLKATLDPAAHTVHGEGTISWRNASKVPVRELWMHLYMNAFKNERSVFLRTPLAGGRGTGKPTDWGYIDVRKLALREPDGVAQTDLWSSAERTRPGDPDETDLRVPLPREVQPGDTIALDVAWDEKLPTVLERTGYDGSFHLVAQWFPKIARLEPGGRWAHFPFHRLSEFYADFGAYDVTLDVPQSFILGATGPAIESRVEKGRRIERHVQADIHDFAWTAWDQWQTAAETIDGVQVTLLYPPNYRVDAKRELDSLRFAMPYFDRRYGRYPYSVLTVVHPPYAAGEAGGMEYPTFITSGGPWYGPPGVLAPELVTVHEYGHQYFYGLVATNEHDWPFLDEGLNSFAEQDVMRQWRGAGSWVDLFGLTIDGGAMHGVLSNLAAHDEKVAQPSADFMTGNAYGALVYFRTSAVLETMRRVYGDELVLAALGRYARKNRFLHPVPDELLGVFSEVMGPVAAATLRTAYFEKGWVDYVVADVRSHPIHDAAGVFDRDGKRETVGEGKTGGGMHEGWALVQRRGTLAFPVDIELTLEDGSTQRVRWNGEGDSIRVPYTGSSALRSAVVDPDERVVIDQMRTNNFATVPSAARASTSRTTEKLVYWAELALQAVLP
jgi:Peptidase family M1 domain